MALEKSVDLFEDYVIIIIIIIIITVMDIGKNANF
jgi:hypothetical protein